MAGVQGSIKQCNQALSKHPNNNLFNVLKALAHDRLGNTGDTIALVEGIITSGTTDDEVLHHCSNLLRGLGEYDILLRLYKSASAAQPQDLGLLQVALLLLVAFSSLWMLVHRDIVFQEWCLLSHSWRIHQFAVHRTA